MENASPSCSKEHTLSQEELGEQLNVSRQAIYKWERNASLPEIEKLIALSKLFGVSVGYLLGVEEQHAQSDPETAPGELSEQQTKLAEEIASRYIAALPQTAKRKKWPYVAAAAAAVAVLLALSTLNGKLNRLDQQYQNLQNSIVNIQDTVSNQIGGISNRVEEVLKSQNTLTADYSTELLRADPGGRHRDLRPAGRAKNLCGRHAGRIQCRYRHKHLRRNDRYHPLRPGIFRRTDLPSDR